MILGKKLREAEKSQYLHSSLKKETGIFDIGFAIENKDSLFFFLIDVRRGDLHIQIERDNVSRKESYIAGEKASPKQSRILLLIENLDDQNLDSKVLVTILLLLTESLREKPNSMRFSCINQRDNNLTFDGNGAERKAFYVFS